MTRRCQPECGQLPAGNYAISLFVIGMALREQLGAGKRQRRWRYSAWRRSGSRHGTSSMARSRTPSSPWARSGLPRFSPTRSPSDCCGSIAQETPTCARPGFARAMTFSAISQCSWRQRACSGPAPGGQRQWSATVMTVLALQGAATVIRQAKCELQSDGHLMPAGGQCVRGYEDGMAILVVVHSRVITVHRECAS